MEIIMKEVLGAKRGDLLQSDGKQWHPISLDTLLSPIIKRIATLEDNRVSNDKKIASYEQLIANQQAKITELQNDLISFLKTEAGIHE